MGAAAVVVQGSAVDAISVGLVAIPVVIEAAVAGGDVAVLVIAGAGSAAEKVLLHGRPSHLRLLLAHSKRVRERISFRAIDYIFI